MKKILVTLLLAILAISCDDSNSNPGPDPDYGRRVNIAFTGSDTSGQQYPLTITYFSSDMEQVFTSEIVQSTTGLQISESKELSLELNAGFKTNVPNGSQMLITSVIMTDLDTNEVIFENHSLTISNGKLFMYNIRENTYTITN